MKAIRLLLFLLICQSFIWPVMAAEPQANSNRPFKVEMPKGWQVSDLTAPRPNSGQELAGGRLRALKADSEGTAAIEFTYLNREDGGQANIDTEFKAFVANIKSEYEKNGLKVSTSEAKKGSLGKLPATEIEITVAGQNKELKQWFAMALGKKYLYALSYTAEKQYYEKFAPTFEKCRSAISAE